MAQVTYYHAQVTSNMVSVQRAEGTVSSLQEAIDRGYRFCMLQAIEASVRARYPTIASVPVPNFGAVFAGIDGGNCQAGVRDAPRPHLNASRAALRGCQHID